MWWVLLARAHGIRLVQHLKFHSTVVVSYMPKLSSQNFFRVLQIITRCSFEASAVSYNANTNFFCSEMNLQKTTCAVQFSASTQIKHVLPVVTGGENQFFKETVHLLQQTNWCFTLYLWKTSAARSTSFSLIPFFPDLIAMCARTSSVTACNERHKDHPKSLHPQTSFALQVLWKLPAASMGVCDDGNAQFNALKCQYENELLEAWSNFTKSVRSIVQAERKRFLW